MNPLFNRVKKLVNGLKQRKILFTLTVILLAGFLVRLYKITNPIADWHSWRQADTASVTRIFLQEGPNLFYPRYYDISKIQTGIFNPEGFRFVEFPIYNLLHFILAKTVSPLSLEVSGRLLSAVASLISGIFIYLIGKRFLGEWGGILACFFFLFLPFSIYFSRVVLPEPMAVTLALASMYLFIKFIDSERNHFLYSSAILFSLSLLIKPFTIFYLVAFAYLLLTKFGLNRIFNDPKLLIRFLLFANLALLPFFVWRIWVNRYPIGIPHFLWAFNGDGIRFRPAFWRWIFGERLGYLILGVWGIVPFVFGLLRSLSERKDKYPFFNHFFLLGMFLYVSVFATANVRHDYYQTIVIPAIALTLAQGTLKFSEFKMFLAKPILLFSILMMLGMSAYQVKNFYRINHPEIVRAGNEVDRLVAKDALVIAPYNGDTAFLSQTKRRGWPVVDDSLEKMIQKGAKYFVSVNFADPDTKFVMENFKVLKKTEEFVIADLTKKTK